MSELNRSRTAPILVVLFSILASSPSILSSATQTHAKIEAKKILVYKIVSNWKT